MKQFFVALSLFAVAFVFTAPAQAASQDECAIWICLPGGFPSGCGAAKSAMKKRIKKFKPPLPSFASCAVNPPTGSGSHMSSKHGYAAYIPEHQVCNNTWDECHSWELETVPASYIKGARCELDNDGYRTPRGCTETYHWAEVFIENELAGPTYYFN